MTLSDSSVRTFEVPLERFHELRYNTAKVRPPLRPPVRWPSCYVCSQALREIYELESHPMLRISGK